MSRRRSNHWSNCFAIAVFVMLAVTAAFLAFPAQTASAKNHVHGAAQPTAPGKTSQATRSTHANGAFTRSGPNKLKCEMDKCESK